MSLLQRYVAAVKRHLPIDTGDQTARELESVLSSQLAELERALGRALNDEDIATVLRKRGHPLQVAATFRTRSLIGPTTYPIYVSVLKVELVLLFCAGIAQLLIGNPREVQAIAHLLHGGYWSALLLFSWTTFAFFLLDSWIIRGNFLQRWDPMRLQGVSLAKFPVSALTMTFEMALASLMIAALATDLNFSGQWFKTDNWVTLSLDNRILTWFGISALLVIVGIAMAGFVQNYWTRITALTFAIAQLVLAAVMASYALIPGLLNVSAAADAVGVSSLVYTARFGLVLLAARSAYVARQSLVKFNQMSILDQRPRAR